LEKKKSALGKKNQFLINFKMNNKNILVVGGTGFLGYHVCTKLIKGKYSVLSISSKKPAANRRVKGVKYIIADIRKKNELKVLEKKKINFIINLAGYIDHSGNKNNLKTHFLGTKNLAEKFLKRKIKNFIQAGTSLEYGNVKSPQKEHNKERPSGKYGRTKLQANLYLEKLKKDYNFPYTVLRIYQIFGPNQDATRLIPFVVQSCLKNTEFPCTHGRQTRDFLYVEDFVDLILKILKSKKKSSGIFNVGSSKPIKIYNLINSIKNKVGKGIPLYGKVKMRKEEQMLFFPDTKKINRIFNWRAKVSLSLGLDKTIKYYRGIK